MRTEFSMESSKSSGLVPPRRTSARKAQKRLLETSNSISSPSEAKNVIAIENKKSASEPIKKKRRVPTITKLESEILNQLAAKEKSQKLTTTPSDLSSQLPRKRTRGRKSTISQLESEIIDQLSIKKKVDCKKKTTSSETPVAVKTSATLIDIPQNNGSWSEISATQSNEGLKEQEALKHNEEQETNENHIEMKLSPKKRGRKPKSIEDYMHLTSNGNPTRTKKETVIDLNVSLKLKKLALVSLVQ